MDLKKTRSLLFIFLLLTTIIRLFYIQWLPISEDEANYWQWSRHIDLGYYDQGPMIAWSVRLGTMLFGDNAFGIRFPAVFMVLGICIVLYLFCRDIFNDEQLGLWVVIASNSSLFFTVAGIIHTYDTPLVFFWTVALYSSALAVFKDKKWAWYIAGAASGCAMLSKYTSGLFPVLLFLFLLTNQNRRRLLARKEPWLAAVIAGLILLPNFYWNAANHWTAFAHTLGKTSGFNFTADEYALSALALVGPVFCVLMAIGLIRAWKKSKQGDEVLSFLLWTSLPIWFLFFFFSLKTRVYANWPAPAYISAVLAAAPMIKEAAAQSIKWKKWTSAAFITGYLLVLIALFHGPISSLLGLPPDINPTGKLYGWSKIGNAISDELNYWDEEEKPFIFGLKYQTASLAAFYTPGQPETACIFLPGDRLNCYLPWTDPRKLKGKTGLAVTHGTPPRVGLYFEECKLLRTIPIISSSGDVAGCVNLYKCTNFKGMDARPVEYLDMLDD